MQLDHAFDALTPEAPPLGWGPSPETSDDPLHHLQDSLSYLPVPYYDDMAELPDPNFSDVAVVPAPGALAAMHAQFNPIPAPPRLSYGIAYAVASPDYRHTSFARTRLA